MKKLTSDVVVIGGGLSGCIAAKTAKDAGKTVTIVFPNGGASELSNGSIDILGVLPGEKISVLGSYKDGMDDLLAEHPDHPYAVVKDSIEDGVAVLENMIGDFGYAGFADKNVWVPNMMGTFSIASLIPATIAESVAYGEEKVLVVGFAKNIGFNAVTAANGYSENQKKFGGKVEYYSTVIDLPSLSYRHKLSDGELADFFDTRAGREELVEQVATYCRNTKYAFNTILFPPVLGYVNYLEVLSAIRSECGVKAAEVYGISNSVVGFRFTRALYKGLEDAGVEVCYGTKAVSMEKTADGMQVICKAGLTDQLHPGKEFAVDAKAVVLATGSYLGGGLQRRAKELWINLLEEELPYITTDQVERAFLDPKGHDFTRVGAKFDGELKADKFDGSVFVCGSLLAGANAINERSRGGIDVASGYLAGANAAKA